MDRALAACSGALPNDRGRSSLSYWKDAVQPFSATRSSVSSIIEEPTIADHCNCDKNLVQPCPVDHILDAAFRTTDFDRDHFSFKQLRILKVLTSNFRKIAYGPLGNCCTFLAGANAACVTGLKACSLSTRIVGANQSRPLLMLWATPAPHDWLVSWPAEGDRCKSIHSRGRPQHHLRRNTEHCMGRRECRRMHYDLGHIDLEQKTLQTTDTPFGSRMSPMS